MTRNWIVVASAEHVARGIQGGFVQACHGKCAPLQRMKAGDFVACYSPTVTFRGKDRLRSFTAFGKIAPGEPYRVQMAADFIPYRRNVEWLSQRRAPIEPMLDRLEITENRRSWGYQFRFGILSIGAADMEMIANAMAVAAGASHRKVGTGFRQKRCSNRDVDHDADSSNRHRDLMPHLVCDLDHKR